MEDTIHYAPEDQPEVPMLLDSGLLQASPDEVTPTPRAMDRIARVQHWVGDFGWYQIRVLLATQLGYLAVTGSLLTALTDTMMPSQDWNCSVDANRTVNWKEDDDLQYRSLLYDLHLLCSNSYLPTLFNTITMVGGVVGSMVYGFLADLMGRKPTLLSSMMILGVCHVLLCCLGTVDTALSLIISFSLGFQAGGFMVVNIVMILECVGSPFWRFFCVCVNGWPAGLMLMAGIGYGTKFWFTYHIVYACMATVLTLVILVCTDESPRWLYQHERTKDAIRVWQKMAIVNGRRYVDEGSIERILNDNCSPGEKVQERLYTYYDLTKNRQLMKHLIGLTYSWLASSIMSFALYSIISGLVGDKFLNQALTGLFKGITGMIPFCIAGCIGRKPILIMAITATIISVWAAVVVYFLTEGSLQSTLLVVFSVAGASAIDPAWKVNHLYSTELFPTVVRNMARATCNLGSRIGSIIGPQIAFLGVEVHPALPFGIFGVVSIIQFGVSTWLLPETKGKRMPEALMDQLEDESPMDTEGAPAFSVALSDIGG